MKLLTNNITAKWLLPLSLVFLSIGSCQKEINPVSGDPKSSLVTKNKSDRGGLQQTKTFSSDVVIKWIDMQLAMLKLPLPAGTASQATEKCQAYCGIALYESVVPGMPAYQTLLGQLTDFPAMPVTYPGLAYHWAAAANSALAEMNRKLFPSTAQANKDAINNLENTLQTIYASEVDAATLQRSVAFGKEVADRVFAWAATDGSANINPPYIPPPPTLEMPWLWVPTAPTPPVNPYAFQRRLLVPGVSNGTALANPPTYSTVPGSDFWNMAKDVYDKKNSATADQQAASIYHRDVPGYSPGGNFVSILSQTLNKAKTMLDVAAEAYAKLGIAQSDATVICFTNKYLFNLVRPVTYIKKYIDPSWTTFIGVPNHPEFPSGHATINSAATTMLANMFGDNFQITLHTYDYLNYPPRSFNSWEDMSIEMSDSRVTSGLHYQATCDKSRVQGKQIAHNILNIVKFLKP